MSVSSFHENFRFHEISRIATMGNVVESEQSWSAVENGAGFSKWEFSGRITALNVGLDEVEGMEYRLGLFIQYF